VTSFSPAVFFVTTSSSGPGFDLLWCALSRHWFCSQDPVWPPARAARGSSSRAQCSLIVARLSAVLAQGISLFCWSFSYLRCVLLLGSVTLGTRFCHHLLPREESSLRRLVRAESRPCFYCQVFSFVCPARHFVFSF
jgi:hypothetical protein